MKEKLLSTSHQNERALFNFIELTSSKYKNFAIYITELSIEVWIKV